MVSSQELIFKPSELDFLIREVSVGDFLTSESLKVNLQFTRKFDPNIRSPF